MSLRLLEEVLPKYIPLDIIHLISTYTCNCKNKICNYCKEKFPECYLTICVKCKLRSCNNNTCITFPTDIVLTYYADYHREIKACRCCIICCQKTISNSISNSNSD